MTPQDARHSPDSKEKFGDRVMDKSALYPDHKDLNDYLMSLYPKKINKTQTLKIVKTIINKIGETRLTPRGFLLVLRVLSPVH